jgi:hypothetical protein
MDLRKSTSFWLTISFKFALLASISLITIFSTFKVKIDNVYSIVDSDFGSESESLDLMEDSEEQMLDMFYFDLEYVSLNLIDSSNITSNLNLIIPAGYSDLQLLPPELNLF